MNSGTAGMDGFDSTHRGHDRSFSLQMRALAHFLRPTRRGRPCLWRRCAGAIGALGFLGALTLQALGVCTMGHPSPSAATSGHPAGHGGTLHEHPEPEAPSPSSGEACDCLGTCCATRVPPPNDAMAAPPPRIAADPIVMRFTLDAPRGVQQRLPWPNGPPQHG